VFASAIAGSVGNGGFTIVVGYLIAEGEHFFFQCGDFRITFTEEGFGTAFIGDVDHARGG